MAVPAPAASAPLMRLFIAVCRDAASPTGTDRRQALASRHAEHVGGLAETVRVGGLTLAETGAVTGSVVVLRVRDRDAARRVIEADPFFREGVWGEVLIEEFAPAMGDWPSRWPADFRRFRDLLLATLADPASAGSPPPPGPARR